MRRGLRPGLHGTHEVVDRLRDLLLHREDVAEILVVRLAPNAETVRSTHQLDGDPHVIALLDVLRSEFTENNKLIWLLAVIWGARAWMAVRGGA